MKWIKTNSSNILIGIFVTFIGAVAAGLILSRLTKEPNESYKQVEVDFNNWLEDYDSNILKGYMEVINDFNSRGLFNSGSKIKYSITYFTECRRIRDNKIDSFLVAYSLAGGDTLTLDYHRKLPVNVLHLIAEQISDSRNSKNNLINYRLDTL